MAEPKKPVLDEILIEDGVFVRTSDNNKVWLTGGKRLIGLAFYSPTQNLSDDQTLAALREALYPALDKIKKDGENYGFWLASDNQGVYQDTGYLFHVNCLLARYEPVVGIPHILDPEAKTK